MRYAIDPGYHVSTHCVVEFAGEPLWLLAQRAAFLARCATLLVADLHLGKSTAFRAGGLAVPAGADAGSLLRLSELIGAVAARRVIFLGDFFHSRHAQNAATLAELIAWRTRHADLAIDLVLGNHDLHAGVPPAQCAIHVHAPCMTLGGLTLCHHPVAAPGTHVIAGHLHPAVTLHGPARDRARLPCFVLREGLCILPSFGEFTGAADFDATPADRLYVVAQERVFALPARVSPPA